MLYFPCKLWLHARSYEYSKNILVCVIDKSYEYSKNIDKSYEYLKNIITICEIDNKWLWEIIMFLYNINLILEVILMDSTFIHQWRSTLSLRLKKLNIYSNQYNFISKLTIRCVWLEQKVRNIYVVLIYLYLLSMVLIRNVELPSQ